MPLGAFYSVVKEHVVPRLRAEALFIHPARWPLEVCRDVDSIIPYPCVLSRVIFEMFIYSSRFIIKFMSFTHSINMPTSHLPMPIPLAPDGGIDRSARSHRVE